MWKVDDRDMDEQQTSILDIKQRSPKNPTTHPAQPATRFGSKGKQLRLSLVLESVGKTALTTVLTVLVEGHEDTSTTGRGRALAAKTLDLEVTVDLVVLQDSKLDLPVLVLDLLGGSVGLLLALLGTTAKTEDQVDVGLLGDTVGGKSGGILKGLAREDETLLLGGEAGLGRDLGLGSGDGGRSLDEKSLKQARNERNIPQRRGCRYGQHERRSALLVGRFLSSCFDASSRAHVERAKNKHYTSCRRIPTAYIQLFSHLQSLNKTHNGLLLRMSLAFAFTRERLLMHAAQLPICCQVTDQNPCRIKIVGPTLGFIIGICAAIICWPLVKCRIVRVYLLYARFRKQAVWVSSEH
ncbi:hypothetical protein G7K_0783-t1 [Saitoella complicata NRRL Y-17804]|uniref:Uncharacterized protein n=1 Tax=Saitoella complicata (strain BCRC 22490 / CBS 7301 / JCM 7358 / NBRC 10748 / NRRL Y-17804) TaxID=698492 RepID=A0A0E9N9T3_SAICN|nr:hypothetical protein G7K_0783-t1 [Saitoella complicata NRRL Y-17804]